jgi:hypothetical protein
MSLSITPTLALVGEPEGEVRIRPESLASVYTAWVDAEEARLAANLAEAASFDDLVVTIGRANIHQRVSLRDIASQLQETGRLMPVVTTTVDADGTEKNEVKYLKVSKSTVDRWVALYVYMEAADVTSYVAREVLSGMGNTDNITAGEVKDTVAKAVHYGKDVIGAVESLKRSKSGNKSGDKSEPKPFDPAKEIKRLLTGIANLSADGVNLTTDDKANIASLVIRAQALIG